MCLSNCPKCGELIDHYQIYPINGIMTPDEDAQLNGSDRWDVQRVIVCPHCKTTIHGIIETFYGEEKALKRLAEMRGKGES